MESTVISFLLAEDRLGRLLWEGFYSFIFNFILLWLSEKIKIIKKISFTFVPWRTRRGQQFLLMSILVTHIRSSIKIFMFKLRYIILLSVYFDMLWEACTEEGLQTMLIILEMALLFYKVSHEFPSPLQSFSYISWWSVPSFTGVCVF